MTVFSIAGGKLFRKLVNVYKPY